MEKLVSDYTNNGTSTSKKMCKVAQYVPFIRPNDFTKNWLSFVYHFNKFHFTGIFTSFNNI